MALQTVYCSVYKLRQRLHSRRIEFYKKYKIITLKIKAKDYNKGIKYLTLPHNKLKVLTVTLEVWTLNEYGNSMMHLGFEI